MTRRPPDANRWLAIRLADRPGDRGWVVMANGEAYAEQFGWGSQFEALGARIVADFAGNRPVWPSCASSW
ncbi:hypothetical protein [Nostocoides vanveenii]|uniref:Uncharacterized protein n=1 Tax=Nostocoides vanveenii TaxID=330835 RepID=A0ABP4WSD7_9MICO